MKITLLPTDPARVIPDPATGKGIPVTGVQVQMPFSKYWLRRLRAGDVVRAPVISTLTPASDSSDME